MRFAHRHPFWTVLLAVAMGRLLLVIIVQFTKPPVQAPHVVLRFESSETVCYATLLPDEKTVGMQWSGGGGEWMGSGDGVTISYDPAKPGKANVSGVGFLAGGSDDRYVQLPVSGTCQPEKPFSPERENGFFFGWQ